MENSAIVNNYVELVRKGLRTIEPVKGSDLKPVPENIRAQVKEAYEAKYGEVSAE